MYFLFLLAAFAAETIPGDGSSSTTIYVSAANQVESSIEGAASGTNIVVSPLSVDVGLVLSTSVSIFGAGRTGPHQTTLRKKGASPQVLWIGNEQVTLRGVELVGGSATRGVRLTQGGTLTAEDVSFSGGLLDSGQIGGAVWISGSTLECERCDFITNEAEIGGAIASAGYYGVDPANPDRSSVVLTTSVFSENEARLSGAISLSETSFTSINTRFCDNYNSGFFLVKGIIDVEENSTWTSTSDTFLNNTVEGHLVYTNLSDGDFYQPTVLNNFTTYALFALYGTSTTLDEAVFAENEAAFSNAVTGALFANDTWYYNNLMDFHDTELPDYTTDPVVRFDPAGPCDQWVETVLNAGFISPYADEDGDGLAARDDCDDNNAAIGITYIYPDKDADGAGDLRFPVPFCGEAGGFQALHQFPNPWVSSGTDCDDSDSSRSPSFDEVPYNGVDDDCDALTFDDDLDGDGYVLDDDCDDADPLVHPSAEEVTYDGVDNDCNPLTPDDDLDQDGFGSANDCDDNNPAVHPGATEVPYNGLDDDCDLATLDDDLDQDGASFDEDCDDLNPLRSPLLVEIINDGVDNDCDPLTPDDDLDQDGFGSADDCDDNNASINPDAAEQVYNGVDDDCDPATPDDDLDQDGYPLASDCDDGNALVNTEQTEIPFNSLDDDCDPSTLDDDYDQDGYSSSDDCDDNNPAVSPGHEEVPHNQVDDDCDPSTLDDDLDADGFGAEEDCDDNNPLVFPGQQEVPYNGIDDDCDPNTSDEDFDQDGFDRADDCDDQNSEIHANQQEIPYDGIDNDCDPSTLDDDLDEDGYNLRNDCDDAEPEVHPEMNEILGNNIDDDCDPTTLDIQESAPPAPPDLSGCSTTPTGYFGFLLIAPVALLRRRRHR